MESYLRTLQSQSNMSSHPPQLPHVNSEQYPLINYGGNNQMLGDSLPNEEQLCNFISSLDSSTSLTFEKLLQSSNQVNGYWCSDYNLNPPTPPTYNYSALENNTGPSTSSSRPRIIRGCHDHPMNQWNANLPDHSRYTPRSVATDLNNNVIPCANKNYPQSDFTPKKYECTEKLCQDFLFNQYFPVKNVDCDWNNNVADINNNACAVSENSDVTYKLNIVSFLYHNKSLQTLAGKFHVHLGLNLDQLNLLTQERQNVEQFIFTDVTSTSPDYKPDQSRTERLINGCLNEVKPVKNMVAKLEVFCGESIKDENRHLIDSWTECIENVELLHQNCRYLSRDEYLTQQILNFKTLCSLTRRIRTCLWYVKVLVTDKIA